MKIIERNISFVKEQMAIQSRLARRYANEQWRAAAHLKTLEQFESLLVDLEEVQKLLDANSEKNEISSKPLAGLFLSVQDLEGLPDELVSQLSISDADKLEFTIIDIIEKNGGVVSLDRLLVDLYKVTGEIYKRNTLTSRLYRMGKRDQVFPVPGKKGIYATRTMSEDEAKKVFGQFDDDEPTSEV